MRNSNMIMAASGTATLECALIGTPTLVAYKMSALTGFLAKLFIKVKYVSLANIIPDKLILPEFLLKEATADNFYQQMKSWLEDRTKADAVRNDLAELRNLLGEPGVAARTAKTILQDLAEIRK